MSFAVLGGARRIGAWSCGRGGVDGASGSQHWAWPPLLRLNAVCPYYTMFPLDFPFTALRDGRPGERVLDPFCGRGTTNFAARLRGLPSVGIDCDSVACAIAAAKLVTTTAGEIAARCETILAKEPASNLPAGEFWELCFHKRTLEELCRLRSAAGLDVPDRDHRLDLHADPPARPREG